MLRDLPVWIFVAAQIDFSLMLLPTGCTFGPFHFCVPSSSCPVVSPVNENHVINGRPHKPDFKLILILAQAINRRQVTSPQTKIIPRNGTLMTFLSASLAYK